MGKCLGEQIIQMDKWMDGWMDDKWVGGWLVTNGQVSGWMGGRLGRWQSRK